MSVIEVNGVSKSYYTKVKSRLKKKKINAVESISFDIKKGEAVGFLGPNGAGKSTTVKMLTGILKPTSGSIRINGIDPFTSRKKHVKNIGVVFGQKTQLWWDLPVIDSLELLKEIYSVSDRDYKQNLDMFNSLLNLNEFINQPVRQLSLGQRMKADIAASLLHNPDFIFFDEPTIGLDVVAKKNIREFIKLINREHRSTILFTTHDMDDIESVCSRVIIIDKGGLIYDGSLESIKEKYGVKRKLIVDFKRETGKIDIPQIDSSVENPFKQVFTFNKDYSLPKLIESVTKQSEISDLTVEETDIESIIREIYLGEINCDKAVLQKC